MHYDNQSAIFLMKNPTYHERTKHIDTKLQFIREIVNKVFVRVEKVPRKHNPSDALAFFLPIAQFSHYLELAGMISVNWGIFRSPYVW